MTQQAIQQITDRIRQRSEKSRAAYIERCQRMHIQGKSQRGNLSCSNLAHGFAACSADTKQRLKFEDSANIAIVSAYNDMLSAHQPFESYPQLIKETLNQMGSTAQFAGGVPAMCDGVTQGTDGMELSLFSRDNIASATAVALSHQMFDGVLCLGVCDKIVPGLLIGALSFGHLPTILVPAGPMGSGLPNKEKAKVRQDFAEGKASEKELLEAESAAYHSPGTCTFYGTANSNQMLMEVMGLHVPGSAFVAPTDNMRDLLTEAAATRIHHISSVSKNYTPMYQVVDERTIVNAIVALLATGGSTNHAIHWVAVARAAGIIIDWQDLSDLSDNTPLLSRVYPNGSADVNDFHEAGGSERIIRELIEAGLVHADVKTIWGDTLGDYAKRPSLDGGKLQWNDLPDQTSRPDVIAKAEAPFSNEGGLKLLKGNIGRSVIKTSAVAQEHFAVKAPAKIFHTQESFKQAYEAGQLNQDFIAVVRFQGPKACGMPELHKLTPYLGSLQDQGFKVALVTDGRMSGASGKVPSAIHLHPEAANGGVIAKIQEGDVISLDANTGELTLEVDEQTLAARDAVSVPENHGQFGCGRELFGFMRQAVNSAEQGATVFNHWEV